MSTNISARELLNLITRIETLNSERTQLAEEIKEIYLEAKSLGFDPRPIREIIKIRSQDPNDRAELDALLETYLTALENTQP
ncbi:MAG: DUF2312 domain-containing protein [Rhodospirillaceae bacterium]